LDIRQRIEHVCFVPQADLGCTQEESNSLESQRPSPD